MSRWPHAKNKYQSISKQGKQKLKEYGKQYQKSSSTEDKQKKEE